MASDRSVYLLYSLHDGTEWSRYVKDILSGPQVGLTVKLVELDSSGSLPASYSKLRRGRVIILLASPGFLKSLLTGQSNSLDALVNDSQAADLVLLFLCGTLMKDFEERDSQGRRLCERFPGMSTWKTVTHDDQSKLPRTVSDLVERAAKNPSPKKTPISEPQKNRTAEPTKKPVKLRPRINFRLVPDEIRCEVWNLSAFSS